MKKKFHLYQDNEIDLIDLFNIFWNEKIRILLITMIFFLIGYLYSYQIPKNYLNSLTIKESNDSTFLLINNLLKNLNINNPSIGNAEVTRGNEMLKKFIIELEDSEEFLFVLKNKGKIEEKISETEIIEQDKNLFKYANLLKISKPKNKQDEFILNLEWNDTEEAIDILRDTINLTLKNLEKSFFKELDTYLEILKKSQQQEETEKLNYLIEQSAIAKELGIADNQALPKLNSFNLNDAKESKLQLKIKNAFEPAEYLRGYKAIDKEIELIKNRENQLIKYIDNEIDTLKSLTYNWINYNLYFTEVKLLNPTSINKLSILLGLIVSVIYVFISYLSRIKNSRKKNKINSKY